MVTLSQVLSRQHTLASMMSEFRSIMKHCAFAKRVVVVCAPNLSTESSNERALIDRLNDTHAKSDVMSDAASHASGVDWASMLDDDVPASVLKQVTDTRTAVIVNKVQDSMYQGDPYFTEHHVQVCAAMSFLPWGT